MSKLIPLTQGQFAIVSDDMYDELNQFKWYARWSKCTKSYYAVRNIQLEDKRTSHAMHRVIMNHPDKFVDHINRNSLDNRRENLRTVTKSQNQMNRRINRKSKSGYKGVSWDKKAGKYMARIGIDKKVIFLGYFTCPKEAHKVYVEASNNLHGEYGCGG
jgi:hypothetical protein